jgi:antitoxin (DNA-binding transcriptional repressor) of toxin-antitoxin stability system
MKAVARSDIEQGGAGHPMDEFGRRMENGFNRIDARLESHGEAITRHGEAIARLEAHAESTAGALSRIDARLEAMVDGTTAEFRRVDSRLETIAETMAAEFTAVRKEMSEGFQRMQRLMIQVGGGIVVTLLVASRLFA